MGCRSYVASVAESQIEIAEGFVFSVKRGSPIMEKKAYCAVDFSGVDEGLPVLPFCRQINLLQALFKLLEWYFLDG